MVTPIIDLMNTLFATNILLTVIVLCVVVLTIVTTILMVHVLKTTLKVKHIVTLFDRDITHVRKSLIAFKDGVIASLVTPKK